MFFPFGLGLLSYNFLLIFLPYDFCIVALVYLFSVSFASCLLSLTNLCLYVVLQLVIWLMIRHIEKQQKIQQKQH